jgi:hypothetical protein
MKSEQRTQEMHGMWWAVPKETEAKPDGFMRMSL